MPFLDSSRQLAALLIALLTLAVVVGLSPYATGLIGIPVLYVVFAPVHGWLARRTNPHLAATLVVVLGIFLIAVPGASFAGLVVNEAQEIAGNAIHSPLLGRVAQLRIGTIDLGPRIAALGENLVSWIGSSAFGLLGTATRLTLNLTISFFGLFYLLLTPGRTWKAVQPYLPFSAENTEKLRTRFQDITISTVIGTGLTAVAQGLLVGLGFWVVGLPSAVFWGVVTMVFAILPVVGSGLVWGPAAIAVAFDHRYVAAAGLALWGLIVVGNVEYVIRPIVFRRWANIHPLVTLVGALAGVGYFGLLGLLVGPLAISYWFELIKMYREEYLTNSV